MGKVLEWVGLGALATVIIAGGGVAGLFMTISDLDKQSRAFANASVDAITPTWSVDELEARTDPQRAALPRDQMTLLFAKAKQMGAPANHGCEGQSNISFILNRPASITARYICSLDFGEDDAKLAMAMTKEDDVWKITGFQVNSPQLFTNMPKP